MDYEDLEVQSSSTPSERLPAEIDLTRVYLREVGSTPLLDREQEVELATKLQQAREDFAAATLKLPVAARSRVLGGASVESKAKQPWSLKQIEDCYELLRNHSREVPTLKRNKAFLSAVDAKRRFDRSRDGMIEANLRLVAHVAKKFSNQGLPYMDLVQEGNIGLMRAVEKFEYERGYKFSTYAFWWIKQAITRAIADKGRTIRVPVHVAEKIKKIKRVSDELGDTLGRQPTVKEIAEKARIPFKKVDELIGSMADTRE